MYLGIPVGNATPVPHLHPERHTYIIGKTGTGKSTFLENQAASLIEHGEGLCLVDPHGHLALAVVSLIPQSRRKDLIYISHETPIPFNVVVTTNPPLQAENIISAFNHVWKETWGPRMEYHLNAALRSLMDNHRTSLLDLPRFLRDTKYRSGKSSKDPVIKETVAELDEMNDRLRQEVVSPIQNKVGRVLSIPMLRDMLGSPTCLDFQEAINQKRIVVVNLSKGHIGARPAYLLGSLIVSNIVAAAFSNPTPTPFNLLVDEFQNFAGGDFETILSEARKFKLQLTLAHQYIHQVPETIQEAVFGNVDTLIVFRIGAKDYDVIGSQLDHPQPKSLIETPLHHAWVKYVHKGTPTNAYLMSMLPPPRPLLTPKQRAAMIRQSFERYGTARASRVQPARGMTR
jgi:DNA helicase HerA-like ATPase